MRYAVFSDLHDNHAGLAVILADAARQNADQLIYLGDVGRDPQLFLSLQELRLPCVFGNWEVSGWPQLPPTIAAWVRDWPATIQQGLAIFCHATPDMPTAAVNTAAAASYMAGGSSWQALFPSVRRNEAARWAALAVLETLDLRVAFHGHTHVQEVCVWTADESGRRQLRVSCEATEFSLETGDSAAPNRYLVGVGSAGAPDDGPQLCYALYDDATRQVNLRRL